jgi:hypothetical protein
MKKFKNVIHIVTGWFRSYFYVSKRVKKLSEERLQVCRECPYAVEKSFLRLRDGNGFNERKKACKFCGCPIVEKSLVPDEKCEMNLWKK